MHERIINIAISSTDVVTITAPSRIVDGMRGEDTIDVEQVGLVAQDL
jgi:hypothetical protein